MINTVPCTMYDISKSLKIIDRSPSTVNYGNNEDISEFSFYVPTAGTYVHTGSVPIVGVITNPGVPINAETKRVNIAPKRVNIALKIIRTLILSLINDLTL